MSGPKSTYINPLTDFGFKFLFGQEGNKEFLLSFLNAVRHKEDKLIEYGFKVNDIIESSNVDTKTKEITKVANNLVINSYLHWKSK